MGARQPLLFPLLAFIGGIAVGWFSYTDPTFFLFTIILSLGAAIFAKAHHLKLLTSSLLLIFYFAVGGFLMHLHHPINSSSLTDNDVKAFQGTVQTVEKEDNMILAVHAVLIENNWKSVRGKVFIANKDVNNLMVGDHLLLKGKPVSIINRPGNSSFDYALYRKKQGILYQFYGHAGNVVVIGRSSALLLNIRRWSSNTQKELAQSMGQYFEDAEAAAVAKALVLGDKADINASLQSRFAGAGVMHLLAVSGLHVGIVYLLCYWLLSWFALSRKITVALQIAVIVVYALLTGLSPSVLRASVMIAIVLVGSLLQRKTNVYNSLIVAAFLLLLINPLMIFQVGFQLSFSAVLGIVWLYPKIHALWQTPNKVINYAWGLLCVSAAAQLATLPLTWLYFQQFPTYFLLPNLIFVPMTGVLIGIGFLGLLLSTFPWPAIAAWIFQIMEYALQQCNSLLDSFLTLPGAVVDLPAVQPLPLILCLMIAAFFILFYHHRKILYLYLIYVLIIGVSGDVIYRHIQSKNQNLLRIYAGQPLQFEAVLGGNKLNFAKAANSQTDSFSFSSKILKDSAHVQLHEHAGLNIFLNNANLIYGNVFLNEGVSNPKFIIIDDPAFNYSEIMPRFPEAIWIGTSGLSYYQRKELTSFASAHGIQFDSPDDRGTLSYAIE